MKDITNDYISEIKKKLSQPVLKELCRRYHVKKLSLFGSVLNERFKAESDIDILVVFEENQHVGYFLLAELELELTKLLGRKVDLRTPAELSRYFRDDVQMQARAIYG
jgi:uncharacterized protein